jgi:hypothetical protein
MPAEECASFAQFWMNVSGAGPETVAAVSRCRLDASGAWIHAPTEVGLSRGDVARVRDIKAQLTGFEAELPAELHRDLADIHNPIATPSMSRVDPRDTVAPRYKRELKKYLKDPAHRELAAYAAWLVARRDAAVATFLEGCHAYHPRMSDRCARLVHTIGADLAPWPWDLDDDLLLAEYLAQRAELSDEPPSQIAD